jgi:hypothetical protein
MDSPTLEDVASHVSTKDPNHAKRVVRVLKSADRSDLRIKKDSVYRHEEIVHYTFECLSNDVRFCFQLTHRNKNYFNYPLTKLLRTLLTSNSPVI